MLYEEIVTYCCVHFTSVIHSFQSVIQENMLPWMFPSIKDFWFGALGTSIVHQEHCMVATCIH